MNDKINILLIEDNPADSELVSIFLKGIYAGKSNLVTTDSLADGLQKMVSTSIDVIILDLSLPDSWGLDTLIKLYEKVPDTPIIVLTGIEDDTIGIDAVKMGAQDFLIKGKIKGSDLQRSINYSIERHKLLQALAEKTNALYIETQKLSEAQKLAHIGSWEWDIATNKVSWSDEFFRIHGMKPRQEKLTTDSLAEYIHPDDREHVGSVINNIIKTADQTIFTYRIIRKDGTIRTLYSGGEGIKDSEGKVVKIVGTGQDITERQQEEEMEKLATAATKSFNSVIITNEHGNIEWVNDGFTALTGYTFDEVKGSHGESLRKGSETGISEDTSYFRNVIQGKLPITYESKNYSKNGREYWTITTLTPVLDRNRNVKRIIAIDSDITMGKQMEENLLQANQVAQDSIRTGNKALEELMKAKKQLEESVHVKEQFLANMSHEIRTPMNAIVGFTDLTLKTELSQEQKQYIEAIKTSGENLIVIINDILDFSKIQSGKVSFENIEFSISQVVSTVTELMLPKSIEKNIKLSKSIDKNIPDRLIGDPTRLNQILLNLLGNAIKFTQKGEVKVSVELLSEDTDLVNMRFLVSDTGIGIQQEKIPTLFDAFTQATYDTTRKYGGTGLGLAIVKQLIELMGGTIKIASEVNKGTTFTFTLNYRKNLNLVRTKKSIVKEDEPAIKNDLHVLLVEDNTLNQILAQKVLTDWGWTVEIADNGLIAVEKIKKEDFDLVLMDIQMPEMDGYETTHYIRKKLGQPKSDIPVIAMTAHAISGEEEKCVKVGMNGYISKPFNTHKLYQKINSVLHMKTNGTNHTGEEKNMPENGIPHKYTDLTYLRGIANGSDTFIIQMLSIFNEQTPEAIIRMEKALKEKDWKTLRMVVHKIKPSIMFTGLTDIINDVPLLEEYAATESNLDAIPGLVDKIKNVCTRAIVELKEELDKLKQPSA